MASHGLDIKVTRADEIAYVSISGAVDPQSAEKLKSQLMPLCAEPHPRIILDCSGLTYINSLCMGQMTAYHKTCEANGGRFALCGVESRILEVMKLIHLDELVTICASRSEAMAAVGAA